jgi:hypothetical protein
MTDVDSIAAGLSEAQKRAIRSGERPSGAGKWPLQSALVDKGLAQYLPWKYTTLGLAVRAKLEADNG